MGSDRILLSLIVPAYNEAGRIAFSMSAIHAYLGGQSYRSEIIVVDDGSSDGTSDVVRKITARFTIPVRVLRYESNRGKGHALKVGFAASRGERILFADADLSTPIKETGRLLESLDKGFDIAIGSRRMKESAIKVHQPWYRERMGAVFTCLVQRLISNVSDVTCGFKAFRGEVGRDLFSRVRVYDWSFDAEILLIAEERGYTLEEVPVRWDDRAGTKVSLLRDALRSLLGLVRIRINAATGRYREPTRVGLSTQVWHLGDQIPASECAVADPESTP
jgi:dolichyl-phosphate beta-glucosyltransferase